MKSGSIPRITHPNVHVDRQGRWSYQEKFLSHEGILSYFKQHLKRNQEGNYYIENTFGKLKEHAYLDSVKGFPLNVTSILPTLANENDSSSLIVLHVILDSGEKLSNIETTSLLILTEDIVAIILKQRGGVPARLNPSAMTSLTDYLYCDPEGNYHIVLPSFQKKSKIRRSKLEELFPEAYPKD